MYKILCQTARRRHQTPQNKTYGDQTATVVTINNSADNKSENRVKIAKLACVSLAPALNAAELARASGKDLLLATAIAFTVNGLLAEQLRGMQGHRFMPSGVVGAAGAAAVGKILKLDAEKITSAIGIGLGGGQGLFQYYFDQKEDKKLIVARATRAGVEAAQLAADDWEGPAHIIEGAAGLFYGFLTPYGIKPDTKKLLDGFEKFDGTLFLVPKFFACSFSIIPFLEVVPFVKNGTLNPPKSKKF